MFAAAIAYLESKTPTWIKVCVALVVVGWMAPIEMRDWFYEKIDTRVHAVIAPMKIKRDTELRELSTRIDVLKEKSDETNAFVRAMALEQLGAKRFQEVQLTSAPTK
jgi:hypothetical protein